MAATLTVASSVSVSPVGAVARTAIVRVDGAGSPAAEKVTDWPGVSNVPSLSRSQRYVSGWPSGWDPVALTTTLPPTITSYGPPALTVGGLGGSGGAATVWKVAT